MQMKLTYIAWYLVLIPTEVWTSLRNKLFPEHQADHFEEQAPIRGSSWSEATDERAVGSL